MHPLNGCKRCVALVIKLKCNGETSVETYALYYAFQTADRCIVCVIASFIGGLRKFSIQ